MIGIRDVESARILLVEAPLGYGKSSFAERVLADRDGLVIRIRTPRPGPDGLGQAVTSALRRSGLAGAADAVAASDAETALDHFVAALADRPGPHAQLLLDDAHLMGREAASALRDVIADLPTDCRVIVSGRDLSPFRPLLTRPDVTVVRADDLRLDATDIAGLLDGAAGARATADELLAATEGWPAAVELAVARLRQDPTWVIAGSTGARGLMRELVERLAIDDPRVPVLARLPLLDDEVVRLVDPRDDRPAHLPARPSGRWRVVPAVIRELFDDASSMPDTTVRAVAAHYRRNGETAAATALLRATAPGELLEFAAGLSWSELADLDLGELRSIVEHLDAVDAVDAVVASVAATKDAADLHAQVLLNAARGVELTDRGLRSRWLERADRIATLPTTARAVTAEIARDTLRSGEVERGAAMASDVVTAAGADEHATRARCLVTIGMRHAYLCTPASLSDAARTFAEAADLYHRVGESRLQAETLARLGYTALYIAGYPVHGARAMSEALALLPTGDRVRAFWLTMYADVLAALGREDESGAAVREALEIGERRRDPTTSGMAWWTYSWIAALRGDAEGVRSALAEVERHRGAWLTGGQEAEYLGSSAEHLSLVGDLDGYREYVDRAAQLAAEIDYPEVVTTPRAYFEAEHGDPAEGIRLLDELETMPAVAPMMDPRRALLRAVALHRAGDRSAAAAALGVATSRAQAMGVPDLLDRMHRRQLDAVADLLAEGDRSTVEPRLRLLGKFELTVGDADRTPQPGHPSTLVKLLALRGTVPADTVTEVLWPGADPATGRARLRNLLNRVKERCGQVVLRTGEELRLDDAIRVDVKSFDQAAAAALAAPPDERVGRARHALALYTGDLLPGDLYEDWAALDRTRLQRQFVSLADLVAADDINRGDLDEAARLLELGIATEPLDETRSLLLCALLADQGRGSAARQVARRCIDALAELQVAPSPALARYVDL